jgi:hypothetical protein
MERNIENLLTWRYALELYSAFPSLPFLDGRLR